jgi:hypothetical protein
LFAGNVQLEVTLQKISSVGWIVFLAAQGVCLMQSTASHAVLAARESGPTATEQHVLHAGMK